jgi:hypothetical protein
MDPLVFAVSPLTAAMAPSQFFFSTQVSDYSLYGGEQ